MNTFKGVILAMIVLSIFLAGACVGQDIIYSKVQESAKLGNTMVIPSVFKPPQYYKITEVFP